MTALALHITNPVDFSDGLQSKQIEGDLYSVWDAASLLTGKHEFEQPTVCLINNKPILRKHWDTVIASNDTVTFCTVVQGNAGSVGDFMRTAALLAVTYYSYGAASALGINGLGASFVTSAAVYAASGVINHLLPPIRDSISNIAQDRGEASTIYNFENRGNRPRVNSPIPITYGLHKVYPDLAVYPCITYKADSNGLLEQDKIRVLYVIGHGYYHVHDFKLDGKSLEAGVGTVLHPKYLNKGSSVYQMHQLDKVSKSRFQSIVLDKKDVFVGEERLGTGELNLRNATLTFYFPRGLYRFAGSYSTNTVVLKARAVSRSGAIINFVDKTVTANRQTPFYVQMSADLGLTDYYFQACRTSDKGTNTSSVDEVSWSNLEGTSEVYPDYSNTTLLLLGFESGSKYRSSDLNKFSVLASKKCPTITGYDETKGVYKVEYVDNFEPNIAWTLLDLCVSNESGELPLSELDSKVDLKSLYELSKIWKYHDYKFNGVFEKNQTVWDSLVAVARCGRAFPVVKNGKLTFVRDARQNVLTAMYTANNIVEGSFSVDYNLFSSKVADHLEMRFFNEATWEYDTVVSKVPNPNTLLPKKITLFGCTNRVQAQSECDFMLLNNLKRRKTISFSTDLQGLIPSVGSTIAVSHDLFMPILSGESSLSVGSGSGDPTPSYTMSYIFNTDSLPDNYLQFFENIVSYSHAFFEKKVQLILKVSHDKFVNTALLGVSATKGEGTYKVHFAFDLYDKRIENLVASGASIPFTFGFIDARSQQAKVLVIKPSSSDTVGISAVVEDSNVYNPLIDYSSDVVYKLLLKGSVSSFDLSSVLSVLTGKPRSYFKEVPTTIEITLDGFHLIGDGILPIEYWKIFSNGVFPSILLSDLHPSTSVFFKGDASIFVVSVLGVVSLVNKTKGGLIAAIFGSATLVGDFISATFDRTDKIVSDLQPVITGSEQLVTDNPSVFTYIDPTVVYKVVDIVVSESLLNFNLNDHITNDHKACDYLEVNIEVLPQVIIGSHSSSVPSFIVPDTGKPTVVYLKNRGVIVGAGGVGGRGGHGGVGFNTYTGHRGKGFKGGKGGVAISALHNLIIDNRGVIGGGGGGGGGSGLSKRWVQVIDNTPDPEGTSFSNPSYYAYTNGVSGSAGAGKVTTNAGLKRGGGSASTSFVYGQGGDLGLGGVSGKNSNYAKGGAGGAGGDCIISSHGLLTVVSSNNPFKHYHHLAHTVRSNEMLAYNKGFFAGNFTVKINNFFSDSSRTIDAVRLTMRQSILRQRLPVNSPNFFKSHYEIR